MKNVWIIATTILVISCFSLISCGNTPELEGEIPQELNELLVHREGHLSYYFPSREVFGDLADGEYIGEISGGLSAPLDKGRVKILVENNRIVDVEVLNVLLSRHAGKDGNRDAIYYDLPLMAVERQSPLVDNVTGATGSTHVFKICLTRALWQASEDFDPMDLYAPY